jgi:hypothetical protein
MAPTQVGRLVAARWNKRDYYELRQGHLNEAVVAERKWQLKTMLRARVYGWRGSRLAISRLKEAASEIKAVSKSDPVAAGDGAVSLMERIWPAFQDIDASSGALGTAVARTLAELIPILIDAPADHATRSKWLERLFEAVQNDGSNIWPRSKISGSKSPAIRI